MRRSELATRMWEGPTSNATPSKWGMREDAHICVPRGFDLVRRGGRISGDGGGLNTKPPALFGGRSSYLGQAGRLFHGDQIQMHWGGRFYYTAPCRDLSGGHPGTRLAALTLADYRRQPIRTLSAPFLRARIIPNSYGVSSLALL